MFDRHFDWSSGKSSTVPVLFPKKYIPLMRFLSLALKSTLPIALYTLTSLANPFGIEMACVAVRPEPIFVWLFVGKPVPLQVTVEPERAQPAIFKEAGLTTIPAATAAGDVRSAITSGMLFWQSPVAR